MFLTVYEVFMLWTLPFWLLLAVETVFLFWAVSCHRGFLALVSLVLVAAALQFFGNVPVFEWLYVNWHLTLTGLGVWLVVSVPWGFAKWWSFVRDNGCRYDEILAGFRERHPDWPDDPNGYTPEQKVEWREYFYLNCNADDWYEFRRVEFDPDPRQHKADIMTWMMFWPWSMLWTLLNDPVRRIIQHLYWAMLDQLQRVRDIYWADKRGHMPTVEEMEAVAAQKRKAADEKNRIEHERWREQQTVQATLAAQAALAADQQAAMDRTSQAVKKA